jgi:3'(2'), 5'-bisphosphate nucleotidase
MQGRMTDIELLDLAADLARRAGHAILGVKRAGFAVEHKADRSVVTEADRIAEVLIAEGLRAATPGIPVVAEEEIAGGHVAGVTPRYWLVDPLDGTRDFAKGSDEYAVCVGLVEHGRAILGAIALPATGEVFAGLLGAGAWKEDSAPRRPIAVRAVPAAGLTVLASRAYADDPRMAPFLAGRSLAETRPCSSAMKFCRVAEGSADLYPRFGGTMEWDTAAGQALVEAAGGQVTDTAGNPLRYGKPDWRNPDFVCYGAAA